MSRPTATCAGCDGTYPSITLTPCPDHAESGEQWCPDCARLGWDEHRAADPHCTCPDCIEHHAEHLEGGNK